MAAKRWPATGVTYSISSPAKLGSPKRTPKRIGSSWANDITDKIMNNERIEVFFIHLRFTVNYYYEHKSDFQGLRWICQFHPDDHKSHSKIPEKIIT
jgi:hypothetical protein